MAWWCGFIFSFKMFGDGVFEVFLKKKYVQEMEKIYRERRWKVGNKGSRSGMCCIYFLFQLSLFFPYLLSLLTPRWKSNYTVGQSRMLKSPRRKYSCDSIFGNSWCTRPPIHLPIRLIYFFSRLKVMDGFDWTSRLSTYPIQKFIGRLAIHLIGKHSKVHSFILCVRRPIFDFLQ